jgi:hypothetical protein
MTSPGALPNIAGPRGGPGGAPQQTPVDQLVNKANALQAQPNRNDCQSLVALLDYAAQVFPDLTDALNGLSFILTGGTITNHIYAGIRGEAGYRPSPRVTFGSVGFLQNLSAGPDDNQVEHFTGGLVAGFVMGADRGLARMNGREIGNGAHEVADRNLNALSLPMGQAIQEHSTLRMGGAQFLNSVANDVKAKICTP